MRTAKISILTLISILILSLFITGFGYAKIDPKTVVGMWLFNEGKGDTTKDSSGNGNDGTLVSNPTWVDGKFGKALQFDGVASYVDCGNKDVMAMTNEVTVQFWFRNDKVMAAFEDRQAVIGKHYLEYEVGIYPAGGVHTYTSDGAGNYDEGINVANAEADWAVGKWRHLAWTLKGTHETVYVDGIMAGEFDKPHAGTQPGTHNLEIGRRSGEVGLLFKGAIDEVAVANVALTQADIEDSMKNGLEASLGLTTAVSNEGKLATYWGKIKTK
jgi:hypothetical protein